MTDISCLLAGLVRIAIPIIALIIWRKKTGAKIYPAIVALLVCFPVFMLGGAIRSGFSYTVPFHYYLQQALLFGILEEGSKFLVLKFVLKSCDSRKDAVSYGIGHSAYEAFGGGIACLLLIGESNVSPDIFFFNLLTAIGGILFSVALTIIIFYGIKNNKSLFTLPLAILFHALGNITAELLIINFVLTIIFCILAFYFWRKIFNPFEDE